VFDADGGVVGLPVLQERNYISARGSLCRTFECVKRKTNADQAVQCRVGDNSINDKVTFTLPRLLYCHTCLSTDEVPERSLRDCAIAGFCRSIDLDAEAMDRLRSDMLSLNGVNGKRVIACCATSRPALEGAGAQRRCIFRSILDVSLLYSMCSKVKAIERRYSALKIALLPVTAALTEN